MRSILPLALMAVSFRLPAHEGTHTGGNAMPALHNQVEITTTADYREFTVDSLPDHTHGQFPNPGNPHKIIPQSSRYRIPLHPTPLPSPRPVGMGAFGLALNGILFEPAAAEFWQDDRRSGWQYEALGHHLDLGEDANHAHVQASGKYHYHGQPTGLITRLDGEASFALLGYAADGYPVYSHWAYDEAGNPQSPLRPLRSSYRLRVGQRPDGPGGPYDGSFVQDYEYVEGLGDLDVANGRHGVTPEYPEGTYYYVITPTFPFIPRYWQGEPGPDFGHPMGGNSGPRPRNGGAPGPRPRAAPADAFPALALLRDSRFTASLHLSESQSSGLSAALRQIETVIRQNRPVANQSRADDRRAQRLALIAAVTPRIEDARSQWLTPEQNHRLDQKLHRDLGADLLLQPEIRLQLQISDTQFSSIYQAIVESRSPHSIELSWGEVGDLLDASQRDRLRELVGSLD